MVFKSLIGPLVANAYYLPADRTGVMRTHQVVVNALIHNATVSGQPTSAKLPLLSGVLADFFGELVAMKGGQHGESSRESARHLEETVLKGDRQAGHR